MDATFQTPLRDWREKDWRYVVQTPTGKHIIADGAAHMTHVVLVRDTAAEPWHVYTFCQSTEEGEAMKPSRLVPPAHRLFWRYVCVKPVEGRLVPVSDYAHAGPIEGV